MNMNQYTEIHIDRFKQDRVVSVVKGEGWKLQMDNKLPEELVKGKTYVIKKMDY